MNVQTEDCRWRQPTRFSLLPHVRTHSEAHGLGAASKGGAIALIAILLLAGCDRQATTPPPPDLTNDVKALNQRVDELSARVTEHRLDTIRTRIRGPQESVEFDPRDAAGYSQVLSPIGTLLVKLQKVEPYLDGYSLRFLIGNPTTARLSGVSGTVKWGVAVDWNNPQTFNSLQEKKFKLATDFPSGAWTEIKLNIGPAKPDQMRRLILAPVFNSVYLRAPAPSAQ